MEPDNAVDKYPNFAKKNDIIAGHLPHGKNGRFAKMIFYFLRADKYAECRVIIPGKEVNLGAGEGMQVPCLLKISGTKDKFKTNRNIAIYFFFQSLNQQSDEFDSITPNALANSKAFSFIMAPSIGISWLLLSIYQLYISTFS